MNRNHLRALTAGAALAALTAGAAATATTAAAAPTPAAAPVLRPVASPQENLAAQEAFLTEFSMATAVGGFGGTVAGAGIGCLVGGIATSPTIVFVPAGCVAGAIPGAGIGAIVGTLAAGGPVLVMSGHELVNTLNAAPGTTKWAAR